MGLITRTYDILTRLAVGNGALVYRAVDKATHRQVVLKLLVQDENVDHRFHLDPLLTDAPRLKLITGAHVCQLLDVIVDEDDGPALVYEFAQGMNGAELPAKRKLEAAQVIDVAAQFISALRSGERQKCPHGDLKPSNLIFMDLAEGRPFTLVLDWALTAYRPVVADDTLPYLAPERLSGAVASHRADLFSAGATLFFLCTDKALIAAKTRTEAEAAWKTVNPAVLVDLRPDLPAKFVQWLCSLLALDLEKRPESAVDALASLAALNPPSAPVPPESFRARPALPRLTLPIASGIAKPPESAKPISAIRKPPPASSGISNQAAAAKPAAKSAPAPAGKSHTALILTMCGLLMALVGGSVWLLFFRNTAATKYAGDDDDQRQVSKAVGRAPAESVGPKIGKTNTPVPFPSATPAPAKKQDASAKQRKPKATPKPAIRNPQPPPEEATPDASVPQPAAK